MSWWLEDATCRHFGWVRNPSEASENFLIGKNRFFFGKNRDLLEIIGIFPKNRRFFAEIFLNDFSADNRKIAKKSADFSDFLFPGLD